MSIISHALQKEITQRLVAEFDPEAIYLFGSYAWGQPEPGSDLDLLVIIQDSQQQPVSAPFERSIVCGAYLRQ